MYNHLAGAAALAQISVITDMCVKVVRKKAFSINLIRPCIVAL